MKKPLNVLNLVLSDFYRYLFLVFDFPAQPAV